MVLDTLAPQLDLVSARGVIWQSWWSIAGTAIGLIVGVTTAVMFAPAPHSTSATSASDPALPRGPRSQPVRTGTSTGMKVLAIAWIAATMASLLVSTALFPILALCFFYIVQTFVVRLRVDDDAVRFRAIVGETIPLPTITAARPVHYAWGDSGGVGIRSADFPGERGKRIVVASKSGEALDIDTTGVNWTIVVPEGTADGLAGDINARLDRLRGCPFGIPARMRELGGAHQNGMSGRGPGGAGGSGTSWASTSARRHGAASFLRLATRGDIVCLDHISSSVHGHPSSAASSRALASAAISGSSELSGPARNSPHSSSNFAIARACLRRAASMSARSIAAAESASAFIRRRLSPWMVDVRLVALWSKV